MLVCAYTHSFGTRDRGCSAHPAFPAPSFFEGGNAQPGRYRAAGIIFVVPANAGTHTPRLLDGALEPVAFACNRLRWLWVPAFAGTTKEWYTRGFSDHVNVTSTSPSPFSSIRT